MAHKDPVILLGYEDEAITDKHRGQINFTANKIGGKPVSALFILERLKSSLHDCIGV